MGLPIQTEDFQFLDERPETIDASSSQQISTPVVRSAAFELAPIEEDIAPFETNSVEETKAEGQQLDETVVGPPTIEDVPAVEADIEGQTLMGRPDDGGEH